MLNRYFRRIENLPLLLSITGEVVGFLKRIENPSIEKVLHDVNVLKFVLPNDLTIEPEQEIIYKNSRYKVTKVVQSRVGRKTTEVEAISAFIELNDKRVKKIEFIGLPLEVALNRIIAGTGWTAGSVPVNEQTHSMSEENQTVLYLVRLLATLAGYEVDFDTVNKKINFVEKIGKETNFIFRYRKNIKEIKKTVTPVQATVIYPYGRGGLTIASVNNGQEYLEDYSWYTDMGVPLDEAKKRFRKEYVWEDERFIYAGTLMRAAQDKLRELSRPQIAYETSVSDINAGELDIGDYCWVIDEELGIRLKIRVVRLEQYPGQEWNNKIELNYLIPGLMDSETYMGSSTTSESDMAIVTNESDISIGTNYTAALEMSFSTYAPTNMQVGLVLVGTASTDLTLDGYFDIAGQKVGVPIRQKVFAGSNIISVTFLLTQIQEGSDFLRLFLKTNTGTFTVSKNESQLYIVGRNLLGGVSAELPRANVVEEVELINAIHVNESKLVNVQLPIKAHATEYVELPNEKFDVIDHATIIIDGIDYTNDPPAMPTGVTYTIGINGVKLEWDENTEDFVAGYNIYVDGIKHNSEVILDTQYIVTGLEHGKSYLIELRAQSVWGVESEPYVIEVEMPEYQAPEEIYFPLPTEVITEYNNWLITFRSDVEHPVMYATDGTFVANYAGYHMRIHNSSRRSRWDWIDGEWVLTDYHFDWVNSNLFTYQHAILSSVDITDYNTGEVLFHKLENSEIPMIEDRRIHHEVPELPHVEGLTEYAIIDRQTYYNETTGNIWLGLFESGSYFYFINDANEVPNGPNTYANNKFFIAIAETGNIERAAYNLENNNWSPVAPKGTSNGYYFGRDRANSNPLNIYGIIYNTKPILDKNRNVILPPRFIE